MGFGKLLIRKLMNKLGARKAYWIGLKDAESVEAELLCPDEDSVHPIGFLIKRRIEPIWRIIE